VSRQVQIPPPRSPLARVQRRQQPRAIRPIRGEQPGRRLLEPRTERLDDEPGLLPSTRQRSPEGGGPRLPEVRPSQGEQAALTLLPRRLQQLSSTLQVAERVILQQNRSGVLPRQGAEGELGQGAVGGDKDGVDALQMLLQGSPEHPPRASC